MDKKYGLSDEVLARLNKVANDPPEEEVKVESTKLSVSKIELIDDLSITLDSILRCGTVSFSKMLTSALLATSRAGVKTVVCGYQSTRIAKLFEEECRSKTGLKVLNVSKALTIEDIVTVFGNNAHETGYVSLAGIVTANDVFSEIYNYLKGLGEITTLEALYNSQTFCSLEIIIECIQVAGSKSVGLNVYSFTKHVDSIEMVRILEFVDGQMPYYSSPVNEVKFIMPVG